MYARIRSAVLLVLCLLGVSACSDPEADKQRYFTSGNTFFEQKKYAEAIVEYRNALRVDNRFGDARFKLAEAYAATGDVRNAFQEYVRAADLLPDNVDAQLKATGMLAMAGRFEDAKTRIQKVLEKQPQNVEAQILLGNILAGMKDIGGAIAQIEEAIQIEPGRGQSYSNLGVLRMAQGDREAARAAFDKAVEVDPKSVQARLALAMFQLQTGEATGAEQTLRSALELDPKDAMTNRAMFALLLATKRVQEAEPYLKAYVEVNGTAQATMLLADYYVALRRYDDAKAVLAPLTKQQASAADAEMRIAQIEYPTDRAAAHARLDGVLTKMPQNAPALVIKGAWLLAEGKRDEALNKALAATKAAPDQPRAHYLAGLVQTQMQDVPAAIASFNEVLRLNPRVAAAQLQLSRLQLAQGATAEAVKLAETALKSSPNNPEARLTLAGGLLAQRDLARADPLINELMKTYPNVASVHALDGMRLLLKKNFTQARASYDRALQLDARSYQATAGLVALDMLEKNPNGARARVEKRLAEYPNDVSTLMLAARVYIAGNDPAKAEQSLRRVIEVAPADSSAYALLGQVYLAQGKLNEARTEFDQVAAKNPKSDRRAHHRGDALAPDERYRRRDETLPRAFSKPTPMRPWRPTTLPGSWPKKARISMKHFASPSALRRRPRTALRSRTPSAGCTTRRNCRCWRFRRSKRA